MSGGASWRFYGPASLRTGSANNVGSSPVAAACSPDTLAPPTPYLAASPCPPLPRCLLPCHHLGLASLCHVVDTSIGPHYPSRPPSHPH